MLSVGVDSGEVEGRRVPMTGQERMVCSSEVELLGSYVVIKPAGRSRLGLATVRGFGRRKSGHQQPTWFRRLV